MKAWLGTALSDAEVSVAADMAPPEIRMGEMLWSAVKRGGLLDERWWTGWMQGVQHAIDLERRAVWVTMRSPEGTGPVRRWRADPVTRLLILNWHRDGLAVTSGISPRDCLALFRGGRLDASDQLLATSRQQWAMRMPGVMLAYAVGDIASSSVSRARSRTMLGLGPLAESEPEPHARRDRREKDGPHGWALALGLEAEWNALGTETAHLTGAARARSSKHAAYRAIERLGPTVSPVHAALRGWCLHALKHERGRTNPQGYTLRTVKGYLGRLARMFTGWTEGNPIAADETAVHDFITEHLDTLAGERRDKTIKAVLSFMRFYNRQRDDDPLVIEMEAYWDEAHVCPDIVLHREYRRALEILSREPNGEELCLVLILAFRTGLRLSEIMGLRVGDFIDIGDRLELVVESNHGRTLKTRTSRRILPLDVLMPADERSRLMDWLRFSREVSQAVGEVWMFGPIALRRAADSAAKGRIEDAIRRASGMSTLRFEHLRHSFASHLLATLLLPQDVPNPVIPAELDGVVSPARRELVADRLLGQQRLGAGAIHAVSQAMGHTGPGTTLSYYCHLLDLALGWYVDRPSTLLPLNDDWLRSKLKVSTDARRKAAVRHRAPGPHSGGADTGYVRPTPCMMQDATPDIANRIASVKLLEAHCGRLTARLRREVDLREELAIQVAAETTTQAKNGSKTRIRHRTSRAVPEGVPWQVIVKALDAADFADDSPATAGLRKWRGDADRLRARDVLGVKAIGSFEAAVPGGIAYQMLVDARLASADVRTKAERAALLEVICSLLQHGCIRLSRLGDARAFIPLLVRMGFNLSEIVLSGTSKRARDVSSADLHDLVGVGPLQADHRAQKLSGRAGWTGSLIVNLRPSGLEGPWRAAAACRFALVMLAIDGDLFARRRDG